jgi:hypothetical protein
MAGGEGQMKKVIHVNQHVIRANRKGGKHKPVLTVKTSKSNTYGFEVEVHAPARIVYCPHNPLSCGAMVWVETFAEVVIDQRKRLP